MRALEALRAPFPPHGVIPPGMRFNAPPGRVMNFVILGMAELVERPSWWPAGTPTSPSMDEPTRKGDNRAPHGAGPLPPARQAGTAQRSTTKPVREPSAPRPEPLSPELPSTGENALEARRRTAAAELGRLESR
jgi:hypothetical protein